MLKKLREEKVAATPAKTKKSKGKKKKKKTPYSELHNEQKKAKKSKKVNPASAETDEMSAGPNGMFTGKTIQEVSHPVESFTHLTRPLLLSWFIRLRRSRFYMCPSNRSSCSMTNLPLTRITA